MRITDLYPDVVSEDIKYEYKAELNPENPVKWAKKHFSARKNTLYVKKCR